MAKVLGTSGNDVLSTTSGNDSIWGGSNGVDEAVFTGRASDYAVTDNGNGSYTIVDLRDGSPDGTDIIRDIDTLTFEDQSLSFEDFISDTPNYVTGSSSDDVLLGSSEDDLFISSGGNDRVWGGTGGVDTLKLSGNLADYDIADNGNGSYTLQGLTDALVNDTIVVRSIEEFDFADQTISLEELLAAQPRPNVGTDGDDNLLGTASDDILSGGAGDDHVWGGTGGEDQAQYSGKLEDYAIWDRGDGSYLVKDLREGTPDGEDIVRDIEVFSFSDRVATLEEFLDAYVEPPFTIVNGTDGDDVVIGTDGDDVFNAFSGNDRVWGGQGGEDTLILTGQVGDYTIIDNETGGAYTFIDTREGSPDGTKVVRDIEHIQFSDETIAWDQLLQADKSEEISDDYTGTAAGENLSGAHTDGVYDAHANDLMIGNAGTDWIRGGPGNDTIYGDDQSSSVATEPTRTSFPQTDLSPFDFESGLYQVINGQLKKLEPETGDYINIGLDQDNYNAVGLNEADGFAYGIGSRNTEFEGYLLRIGGDGHVEALVGDLPTVAAGTFGGDGRLFIKTGSKQLTAIDVETLETEKISFAGSKPGAVHDLVYIDDEEGGAFFGLSKYGQLVKYDLGSQEVSAVTVQGLDEIGPFGAGWTSADGGLYFSDNSTGNIYGISGLENGQPVAAQLAVGGKSNINDGFSYDSAPLPQFLRQDGADFLLGGSGEDTLVGGLGDDFLDGGTGADQLQGGDGRDTADYTRATAGVEADLANGGQSGEAAGDTYNSVERLEGSFHNDILRGDDGANVLRGRDGDDVLEGRAGNDLLRGDEGADVLDGGDGFDFASYFSSETGVTVDLGSGLGQDGDAAGDQLISIEGVEGSDLGGDNLLGSDANDHLYGFGGDDIIDGRGSSDTIHGGDGNDTLSGGDGADFLLGQEGADVIEGGSGADNLQGGGGNDQLTGGADDDRLFGGAGDDVHDGGLGDDHLRGGQGDDTLTGGEGNDTFHFNLVSGIDRITDFDVDDDVLDFTDIKALSSVDDLEFTAVGNDMHITYGASDTGITVVLEEQAAIDTSSIDLLF
ncbi:MAG: hypothetical protein AAGD43_02435 [Pseudomonadota bacterium]